MKTKTKPLQEYELNQAVWTGGRVHLLLFAGKDQVITMLFLITVMLITAINEKKKGGQGKSMFI